MRELVSFMRGLRGDARAFFWLTRALGFCYLGIYLTGFNLYLLRLGYGPDFVGLAIGVGIFAHAVGAYIAGRFARAPRSMVIVGEAMTVVSFATIATTDLLPEALWTPWVLCANALGWLGGAVYAVGRLPYLMSITTADNRMTAFAADQVGGAVAGLCGALVMTFAPAAFASALGTTLDDPAPFRFAMLSAPLVLAIAVIGFARAGADRQGRSAGSVEPSRPHAPGAAAADAAEAASRATALISAMTVVALLFSLGDSAPQFFFNVYMDERLDVSPTTIAMAMGIARVITIIPILALPALGRRWSHLAITMALASLLAASLVPLALVRHELVAAASYVVFCMCREAFEPAFEVLRMSLVPPQWHTRMASRVQSSMAFSLGLASIVGGHVIAALGYVPLFLGACALIAAAVLVLLATRSSIGSSRVARRPEHAA